MFREHARAVERAIISVDVALVGASFAAAALVTGAYPIPYLLRHFSFRPIVFCLVWYVLLRQAGFYRSLRTRGYPDVARKVLKTAAVASIFNAALLFAVEPLFSRRLYLAHVLFATAFLLAWKLAIRAAQKTVRRRGYNTRALLVVGTREPAVRFIHHVEDHKDWGFQVVGCVQGLNQPPKEECAGHPVLGRLDALLEICRHRPVDEVIFALPPDYMGHMEDILPRLEAQGITVRLALDYYKPRHSRMFVGCLGEEDPVPVVTYHRVVLDPTQILLKRAMDLAGSVVGLALTAALFPFIALAIKLDDPGPVFFRQRRVGQNGRLFYCYKFRTMRVDAEARKAELAALNEMSGAIFKIKDDPRITRVGKFLRKSSLDELPQFWNVFTGEMSLVGTRPPTPDEVANYEEWQRGRICIKPGLTGLWQTSGRNAVSDFDEICRLDLSYIDNWSAWLDVKLLFKTVAMVALGVGAR